LDDYACRRYPVHWRRSIARPYAFARQPRRLPVPRARAVAALSRAHGRRPEGAARAGELHRVTRLGEVDVVLDALMATEWVVYTRDCLEHTTTVVDYLARYTRRVLAVDEAHVTLRYRDDRERGRHKALTLDGG
jgi:hypothetical protein